MHVTGLTSYSLTLPDDPSFPIGFGVTASSMEDVHALMESTGYDHHLRAKRLIVRKVVSPSDVEFKHVSTNSGPHVCCGVWYPALNAGFGAPTGRMGKPS